jgi:hypothetical protein
LRLAAVLAVFLSGCASILPTVVEQAADPESPPRKIAAYQIHKWTSKPITKFEKQFDRNRNGVLEPNEVAHLRMARGFYHSYGKVWKYDTDHDWRFNQEEYYDASGSNQ